MKNINKLEATRAFVDFKKLLQNYESTLKTLNNQKPKEFNKNNLKKNNDNSTNNGNIILTFQLKLYSLESYGRELQHTLKSTLLDN
ncbi:hypothetical protein H8356DRAFT_1420160 [Neocallimastix lanati (nom. inval.)]|nr:hypothetical protein H8356DRAFT_1420160 [Neocallimastix sp. JGI-2020a]